MKIDLEKFICSLIESSSALSDIAIIDICNALSDQGLEYRDGAIVEVEQKKEPLTDFECGYKQAIEDAVRYMDKVWGLNILGNSINDFRETMEQNLYQFENGEKEK